MHGTSALLWSSREFWDQRFCTSSWTGMLTRRIRVRFLRLPHCRLGEFSRVGCSLHSLLRHGSYASTRCPLSPPATRSLRDWRWATPSGGLDASLPGAAMANLRLIYGE